MMKSNDEGLELIKAFLLQKGYPLYESIWSDQPPVYTWLLSAWTQIFGKSLVIARLLSILFSVILLFTFRRIIAFYFGRLTSIFAITTLFFSQFYIQLSVSVMQAIPSLSLGVCSLYLLIISQSNDSSQKLLLVCSGILLGLAIQLKFWVIVLIPVFTLYLLSNGGNLFCDFQPRKITNIFSNIGIFSLSLIASILLIIRLAEPFPIEQLFTPHFANNIYQHLGLIQMFSVNGIIRFDKFIFMFAFISLFLILFSWKKEIKKILVPVVWLSFDLIFFWNHRPIWSHYYPIFSIPLVWLSSYCFWWGYSAINKNASISGLKRINISLVSTIYGTKIKIFRYTLAIAIVVISLYSLLSKFNYYYHFADKHKNNSHDYDELISEILNYRKQTKWIYTDNPMLAIQTNLLIPPEVAVVTIKRLGKGSNYEEKLLEVLHFYKPEQIVFMEYYYRSLRFNKKIMYYIDKHYKSIKKTSEVHHYVLKNIAH